MKDEVGQQLVKGLQSYNSSRDVWRAIWTLLVVGGIIWLAITWEDRVKATERAKLEVWREAGEKASEDATRELRRW